MLGSLVDTLGIAFAAAAVCFAVGAAVYMITRDKSSPLLRAAGRLTIVGYAFPGLVYGLGTIVLVATMAKLILDATGISFYWMWTTTTTLLIIALALRFVVISSGSIDTAMGVIPPSYDAASRVVGKSRLSTLFPHPPATDAPHANGRTDVACSGCNKGIASDLDP